MELVWRIAPSDADAVRELVRGQATSPCLVARQRRNLADRKAPVPRDVFWRALVAAQLLSRRRAAAGHPVVRFLRARPFALDYAALCELDDPFPRLQERLRDCGGLGRSWQLPDQLASNLQWLRAGGWPRTETLLARLTTDGDRLAVGGDAQQERSAAGWMQQSFQGIGPREAANLLQMLGLSRWYVPLDARLVRWLNRLPTRPPLSAAALADRNYYDLVQRGVQQLAAAADTLPCLLDAAVLAASGLPEDDATCW